MKYHIHYKMSRYQEDEKLHIDYISDIIDIHPHKFILLLNKEQEKYIHNYYGNIKYELLAFSEIEDKDIKITKEDEEYINNYIGKAK